VQDTTADFATATVTVTYLPEAADDADPGNTIGTTVNVPVLGNDTGVFTSNTVRIVGPGGPVAQLVVAGEGTWRANTDGTVTFEPEAGFLVDPAPVRYRVTDVTGDTVEAQVAVTYVPTAVADRSDGNALGTSPVIDPLPNDIGDFDATSVRLVDSAGTSVTSLTVAGEGVWTVDTADGRVTFAPAAGYVGNPTPVGYRVTDVTGDTAQSTITVTYLPAASNDQSLGNTQGSPVSVSILGNDAGALDVSTARLLGPGGTPMMNVVVAGEGTWNMNAVTGVVTFTPAPGFTGDPTPIDYRVFDVNGNPADAQIVITYLHPSAIGLALTGMSSQTPLMLALVAIVLGLGGVVVAGTRRVARHRL
jgi:CshA-type fibril repeat protein